MKKTIVLALVAIMLFVNSACADSFALHSGVAFGMTIDEVVEIEEQAGFSVSIGENAIHIDTEYLGGMQGGRISYYFSSDGYLIKSFYQFASFEANYTKLNSIYSQKYGDPITTGKAMQEINGIAGSSSDVLDSYNHSVENYTFNYGTIRSSILLNGISQWFVPLDNGGVVEIILISYERVGTYTWSANTVTYLYRSPEESKDIFDLINQKKSSFGDI